jgi:hypothetical protein
MIATPIPDSVGETERAVDPLQSHPRFQRLVEESRPR